MPASDHEPGNEPWPKPEGSEQRVLTEEEIVAWEKLYMQHDGHGNVSRMCGCMHS